MLERAKQLDDTILLHVERVHTLDTLLTYIDEWKQLLTVVPRATCFQHPDWLITWWRNFGADMQLYVLCIRDDNNTLLGVVPLQRTCYGHGTLRVLRWLGQSHGALTDTSGPLFAVGYEYSVMQKTLAYLAAHRDDWDMLALAHTPDAFVQEIADWCNSCHHLMRLRNTMGWLYIKLPRTWEVYERTLSKNLRSNLARYRNRLRREGHQVVYRILTEPTAILSALPQLFVLHHLRAEAEQMKQHTDYFASTESKTFIAAVTQVLSEQQKIALAHMSINGRIVAVQLLLFQGSVMSLYFSGFDPAWSHYSVMMLTTRASIEYALVQGMLWVDLTVGAASQAKRQWGNEEILTQYVVVAKHSLAGMMGWCGDGIVQWFRQSL